MTDDAPSPPRWPTLAALSGVAAGAVTVGSASLLAGATTRWGITSTGASPLVALASSFIDLTPAWLRTWAVSTFGTNDKVALATGMVAVLVVLTSVIGWVGAPTRWGGRDRPRAAAIIVLAVGAIAIVAVLTRAGVRVIDPVPTVIGTALGLVTLRRLWRQTPARLVVTDDSSRRRVLGMSLGLVAGGVLATVAGQWLGAARARVDEVRVSIAARLRPAVVPEGVQAQGATPFVTPNGDFYRIDTAFVPPVVDPGSWRLRVVGMVEREVELTLDDLLEKPLQQSMVSLACVSNPVGGPLVGNAVWTGWPVRELLALAGPKEGADMVLSRSVDGFTASTPLGALTDDRDALIAVGMNGEPLPVDHGFPARLVVPGLYGYVSATKWVTELKVTRFSDDVAYWTTRGWSDHGPIKTASRIDVPTYGETIAAGRKVIAGVAWAQHRGITKVEVSIDWQEWRPATLATEPTIDAWRQWWIEWDATSGPHTLIVRAHDGTGEVQDVTERPPDPDGATGYHTVKVTVS